MIQLVVRQCGDTASHVNLARAKFLSSLTENLTCDGTALSPAAWLFMPVVVFMTVLVVASYKFTSFLRRRVEKPPPALIHKISEIGMVSHMRSQLESRGCFSKKGKDFKEFIREVFTCDITNS